jgi:hypothetical protein
MRKGIIVVLGLLIAGSAGAYLFAGTPKWGQTLVLADKPLKSVELYWAGATHKVTDAGKCAEVAETLRSARQSPVSDAAAYGTLTLHFADGKADVFSLMASSRFSALEIAGNTGGYAISMNQMIHVFQAVGLMTKGQ